MRAENTRSYARLGQGEGNEEENICLTEAWAENTQRPAP